MSWLPSFRKRRPKAAGIVEKAEAAKAVERVSGMPKISQTALTRAATEGARVRGLNPYRLQDPPPGVIPKGAKDALAMDNNIVGAYQFAQQSAFFSEGLAFMGFPYLSELTQRAEYRRPGEILAKEMTRKWIEVTNSGDEDKSDKIAEITQELDRLNIQALMAKMVELDSWFGRAHLYVDTGDTVDPDELKKPLPYTPAKIEKGKKLRFAAVEPIWVYPNVYNSNDPLVPSFYRPETWFVMGKELHFSRLMTFVFRPVPDILKAAYVFAGISLSQIAKPYVDNWLTTRQSIADMVTFFSQTILSTDLSTTMQDDGDEILKRVEYFTALRSNRGVMVVNKDTESVDNKATPLSGLEGLQAQAQEHMAAVWGIPLIVLLGITPTGLNASSEGEIRVFYDWIHAQQEANLSPHLKNIIQMVQLSLYGEIDPDIGHRWEPLWGMDEKELAETRKMEAETDSIYLGDGVLSAMEVRTRIATDEDSVYTSIDVDDLPEPPESPELTNAAPTEKSETE